MFGRIGAAGAGALAALAVVPAAGAALIGGLAAVSARALFTDDEPTKKHVFVSFDYDNDKRLKDFLIGQSRLPDSPFEISDYSLIEAAPERDWVRKATAAIRRADIVVVMVGPDTYRAHGVRKEVAIARKMQKRIIQIIGYRNESYTPVENAGRLYDWNWGNLKKLLSK